MTKFKAIEEEITRLFGFLERHRAHHIFRSSHLKTTATPRDLCYSVKLLYFAVALICSVYLTQETKILTQ